MPVKNASQVRPRLVPPEPAAPSVKVGPARGRAAGILAVAFLLLAAVGAISWWLLLPPAVAVGAVKIGPAVEAVYASGVVEYVRQARLAPVVTAPIQRVYVEEGQDIQRGQLLVQLDDGPQLGTTLQLEAQAAQARAAADRMQRLFNAGFGAQAAHDDAQAQRRAAEAAAAGARARLADFRLVAPFAGRVLRRDAEPGDLAAAGSPLFVIADPHVLRVTADVDERDIGRLRVGIPALVRADAFPDRSFPARVTSITPQGDANGRIFRVRLSVEDGALRPGMTVETNLVTRQTDHAVLAPTKALKDGSVWVVSGERVRRQPVRTGVAGPTHTEITAGLAPGAKVVLAPSEKLKDGGPIRILGG